MPFPKLSHFASSFRPSHLPGGLRGSFGASSQPTQQGTTNFFTAATQGPSASGSGSLGGAAPGLGASGNAGARPGGSEWNAHKNSWTSQSTAQLLTQAPASSSDLRASDEDDDVPSRPSLPERRHSIVSPPREAREVKKESEALLSAEEAGLDIRQLVDQSRYRDAWVANRLASDADPEEVPEADEYPFPVGTAEHQVDVAPRPQPSLSRPAVGLPRVTPTQRRVRSASLPGASRALHTATPPPTAAFEPPPPAPPVKQKQQQAAKPQQRKPVEQPRADKPAQRRVSMSGGDGRRPRAPERQSRTEAKPRPRSASPTARSPASGMSTAGRDYVTGAGRTEDLSPEQRLMIDKLVAAGFSKDPAAAEAEVRGYLSSRELWSTHGHRNAMRALFFARQKHSGLAPILELYYDKDATRPPKDLPTDELMVRILVHCQLENNDWADFVRRRKMKRELVSWARGDRVRGPTEVPAPVAIQQEEDALRTLEGLKYLELAESIFAAMGRFVDLVQISVWTTLLRCYEQAGRLDDAKKHYQRLKNTVGVEPNEYTFGIMLDVARASKDPELARTVHKEYIKRRASGSLALKPRTQNADEVFELAPSIKHAYDARPTHKVKAHDANLWHWDDTLACKTIATFHESGQTDAAVALLAEVVAGIEKGSAPPGMPCKPSILLFSRIALALAEQGDPVNALQWIKKTTGIQPTLFDIEYTIRTFYAVVTLIQPHLASSPLALPPYLELTSAVFDVLLRMEVDVPTVRVAEFSAVLDANLAGFWVLHAVDANLASQSLDRALQATADFLAAAAQGRAVGIDGSFRLAWGMSLRTVAALAFAGRMDECMALIVDTAKGLKDTGHFVEGTPNRDADEWRKKVVFGMVPYLMGLREGGGLLDFHGDPLAHMVRAQPADLRQALGGLALCRRISGTTRWIAPSAFFFITLETYARDKKDAHGDAASLQLSAAEWLTLLECAAQCGALAAKDHAHRNVVVPCDFDTVLDDFASSGVVLPPTSDLTPLRHALEAFRPTRVVQHALAALNGDVRAALQQGPREQALVREMLQQQPPERTTSAFAPPQRQAPRPRLPEDGNYSVPPVLPAYFAEVPPTGPLSVDRRVSVDVERRVGTGRIAEACKIINQHASGARLAPHPDIVSRLIDNIGRTKTFFDEPSTAVAHVRWLYLVGREGLSSLVEEDGSRYLAWMDLEDKTLTVLSGLHQYEDAKAHYHQIAVVGRSAPSAEAFGTMISNMRKTTDDATVAEQMFLDAERMGVVPNVYLYNTLITKLAHAKRASVADHYFDQMKRRDNLQPSSITYGAMVSAFGKVGDFQAAEQTFEEMLQSPLYKPSAPPYNAMIQMYTQTVPDRASAVRWHERLLRAGVRPNAHTFKCLLDAYGVVGEPNNEMLSVVWGELERAHEVQIRGEHWACLITSYGKVQGNADLAIEVFGRIQRPDAVVYEALIDALIACQRWEECDQYVSLMEKTGVRANAYIANSLIKGLAAQGKLPAARKIFDSLSDPPPGFAAPGNHASPSSSAARGAGSRGARANAQSAGGGKEVVYREPSTWTAMVEAEARAGESDRARALLLAAEGRAFPDAIIKGLRGILAGAGYDHLPLQQNEARL